MKFALVIIGSILSCIYLVNLFLKTTLLEKLAKRKKIALVVIIIFVVALSANWLNIPKAQYLFFVVIMFTAFYRDRLIGSKVSMILFNALLSVVIVIFTNHIYQMLTEFLGKRLIQDESIEALLYICLQFLNIMVLYGIPRKVFIYVYDILNNSIFVRSSLIILSITLLYLGGLVGDRKSVQFIYFLYSNEVISVMTVFIGMFTTFILMIVGFYINQGSQQKEMYRELEQISADVFRMNEEMSLFRHDYMNILYSLRIAVQDEDMEQIKDVFNNTIMPTEKIFCNQKYQISKFEKICIPEIKSLLYVKFGQAQSQNIDISFQANGVLRQTTVPKIILIRIFSIFMDNAIAGTEGSKVKQIEVEVDETDRMWIFKFSNTIAEKVSIDKIFEKGFSTKKDRVSKSIGLGLYYVESVIEQYSQLELETEVTQKYFTQNLSMKKVG